MYKNNKNNQFVNVSASELPSSRLANQNLYRRRQWYQLSWNEYWPRLNSDYDLAMPYNIIMYLVIPIKPTTTSQNNNTI